MSLRKKYFIFLLILFAALVTYLLWPLGSPEYDITTDPLKMQEKKAFLQSPAAPAADSLPNIILITVDDLGMADCSLYEEGEIETPNISKLGEQGIVFENAYVTSPVCAPSRAAMITGRYQHRYGFEFTMHDRYLRNRLEYFAFRYVLDSDPWVPLPMDKVPDRKSINKQGLPESEVTLAEVLKRHGYKTGIVGKWHLGWGDDRLPSAFGFEEQYGFFMSHSLYIQEGAEGYVDQKIKGDWTDPYIWAGKRKGPHAIYRNNEKIKETGYLTDRITEESIGFIESRQGEPFFLWVSYNAPHTPLQAPEEYVNRYLHIEDPVRRLYLAMIASLDDALGTLTGYLKEQGLDENTLIFFISDNGGAEYTLTTDNGPYEGGKNTEFEGGVKVPMIIRWPGSLPQGMRYGPMVSSLDIFNTALAASGAEYMPGRELDGVNLIPYLQDSLAGNPHEFLFWKRGVSKVVRSEDWKLMINDYSGDTLLYRLTDNKYEHPELSAAYPETVSELESAWKQWSGIRTRPVWPSVIYFTAEKDGKTYYFEQ